jgi:hypothetical protein
VLAPAHPIAIQGPVAADKRYVQLTWDRNDHTVTKYDVLRDGAVVGTVGPFTPYDPGNAAHRDWYTGGDGVGGYANEVLADKPVYFFRLEQLARSLQLDSGPNELTGNTESNGVQTALPDTVGPITGNSANNAKVFDGVDDRFVVSSHAALDVFAGAWSIETWVKRNTFGTEQHFFRRSNNAPLLKWQADNTIRVRQLGVADIVGSTVAVTDTNWHHIVVTCTGPTATPIIYLDGVNVTGARLNAPNFANGSGFVNIGGAAAAANHFNGALDEPALYATALSATRAAAHYDARAVAPVPAVPPFDDTWNKCAFKDATVSTGRHLYQVRPYVGAVTGGLSVGASIDVLGDAAYGTARQVAAPSGGDDTAVLQAAIDTAQAEGGIAVLQAGIYLFTQLVMNGLRMVLRGQGKGVTFLRPIGGGGTGPGVNALSQITITGSQVTLAATLSQAVVPGTRTATFTNVNEFQAGSVLMFTAPAVGGTALAALARGDQIRPGEEYDEINRWEANEVVSIAGNVVTFKYPFSQPLPTTASVVRLAEPAVGNQQRGQVFESFSIEGVSATDATFFIHFNGSGLVGTRWADVRARWANGGFVTLGRCESPTIVGCDEPDHGAVSGQTVQYTLNLARVASARVIGNTFGTAGEMKVRSPVVTQRAPRTVVRHNVFHWPDNYACNEHGGGSRDWLFENNWFNLSTETEYAGVFCGNPDFANSGRGIIRNNRQDRGPILAYIREHGSGIRILDNIAYSLAKNSLSLAAHLVVWGGWDSPHDQAANWGAAKLTARRNALFGSARGMWLGRRASAYFGDGTTSNPDPAGDGKGYLGVKDVVVSQNHLHTTSTRFNIEGTSTTSTRFQVHDNTGTVSDTKPSFSTGVFWNNNGDGQSFGAPTAVPWTEEAFAWEWYDVARSVAPSNLTAVAASANQVELSWESPHDVGGHIIERRVGTGAWEQIASDVIGRAYTDPTVSAETTYEYRVAIEPAGTSTWSNVASVTTPAVPVEPVFVPPAETPDEVFAGQHTVLLRAEVLFGGQIVKNPDGSPLRLPITAGRVDIDGSAERRRRVTLTLVDEDLSLVPLRASDVLSPYGHELRVYRGAIINGEERYWNQGTFRIDDSSWDYHGSGTEVTVDGYDRSVSVSDAGFARTLQVPPGENYGTAIARILQSAIPTIEMRFTSVVDHAPDLLVYEEDSDPWRAAQEIAESIGMELFFDVWGRVVLRPVAQVSADAEPVATYRDGVGGTLVGLGSSMSTSPGYNRFVVTSAGLRDRPIRVVIADANPDSPTYVHGPYGRRSRHVRSEKIETKEQGRTMARGLLAKELGGTEVTTVTTWPDPRRTVGNVVRVQASTMDFDRVAVAERITMPLEINGRMTLVTKARYPIVEGDL